MESLGYDLTVVVEDYVTTTLIGQRASLDHHRVLCPFWRLREPLAAQGVRLEVEFLHVAPLKRASCEARLILLHPAVPLPADVFIDFQAPIFVVLDRFSARPRFNALAVAGLRDLHLRPAYEEFHGAPFVRGSSLASSVPLSLPPVRRTVLPACSGPSVPQLDPDIVDLVGQSYGGLSALPLRRDVASLLPGYPAQHPQWGSKDLGWPCWPMEPSSHFDWFTCSDLFDAQLGEPGLYASFLAKTEPSDREWRIGAQLVSMGFASTLLDSVVAAARQHL